MNSVKHMEQVLSLFNDINKPKFEKLPNIDGLIRITDIRIKLQSNVRATYDIENLRDQILKFGLHGNITVAKIEDDADGYNYLLIDGYRRVLSCLSIINDELEWSNTGASNGCPYLNAIVLDSSLNLTELGIFGLKIISNDTHPFTTMDVAHELRRLYDSRKYNSYRDFFLEIGEYVNFSYVRLTQLLKLTSLSTFEQTLLNENRISITLFEKFLFKIDDDGKRLQIVNSLLDIAKTNGDDFVTIKHYNKLTTPTRKEKKTETIIEIDVDNGGDQVIDATQLQHEENLQTRDIDYDDESVFETMELDEDIDIDIVESPANGLQNNEIVNAPPPQEAVESTTPTITLNKVETTLKSSIMFSLDTLDRMGRSGSIDPKVLLLLIQEVKTKLIEMELLISEQGE